MSRIQVYKLYIKKKKYFKNGDSDKKWNMHIFILFRPIEQISHKYLYGKRL
jgi:hypothetical protein